MAADKILSLAESATLVTAILCLITIIGLVVGDVIGRAFGFPLNYTRELSGYLMVAIIFLPGAYSLRRGQHVAIEIVTERLGLKARAVLLIITDLITLVVIILIAKSCWELAITSYISKLKSNTLLMIPLYLPQLSPALGMSIFAIESGVKTINSILHAVRSA